MMCSGFYYEEQGKQKEVAKMSFIYANGRERNLHGYAHILFDVSL